MRFFYLLTILLTVNLFGADMIYIELTSDTTINFFASILINITAVIAPFFGAIALIRAS